MSCGDDSSPHAPAPMPEGTAAVGESCSSDAPCRPGLACEDDVCEPAGTLKLGASCVISPECEQAQCVAGSCQVGALSAEDSGCETDADCAVGLRCQLAGLTSLCVEAGTRDVGASCEDNRDCFAGLYCIDGACSKPSKEAPFGGTAFAGVACSDDESGPPRAYFEVPGAEDADEKDFFRLPFPNDARRTSDGALDLTDFPSPGRGPLQSDPLAPFIAEVAAENSGWGTDPVVIFRFSAALDPDSLEPSRVHFVDLDPELDEDERDEVGSFEYSAQRTAYVCANWLAVTRPAGRPLKAGHVYAAYLSEGLLDESGAAIEPSNNLQAVLADDAPSDEALSAVHERYAQFREYLQSNDIEASSVVNVALITAAPAREPMAQLASVIAELEPPPTHDWVKCDVDVESPCPDHDAERGRACGGQDESFDEFQALVDLPIFQRGEPPYLTPEDGGDIDFEGPQRSEAVCLSLTVPRGEMPEAGWPLVVFAHGTGGSYREHVTPQIAARLAAASLPDGDAVPIAVLGIDQVQHGPRRGSSTQDPNYLFFNFLNPKAARGNALQAAADQLSLARLLSDFSVEVGDERIAIDAEKLFFFGHAQGSSAGSLMLPFSSAYKAAVLSGSAAGVRDILLGQQRPFQPRAALPALLGDASIAQDPLGRMHPALSLIAAWMAPVDPLNFASALVSEPLPEMPPRHVFQTYGVGDNYGPSAALKNFAIAAGLTLVDDEGRGLEELPELPRAAAPLAGNADDITAGVRQYPQKNGIDGNFVAFASDDANADVVRFFATAAHGDTPVIGE